MSDIRERAASVHAAIEGICWEVRNMKLELRDAREAEGYWELDAALWYLNKAQEWMGEV